jgi:hypothetical protein
MSKTWWTFIAVVALILLIAGSFVILEWFGPSPRVSLEINGEAGLRVIGEAIVDGRRQRLDATLPAKFTLDGKRVLFRLVSAEDRKDSPLQGRVLCNGAEQMSATAAPGISGELYRPLLLPAKRTMISSFQAPDEDAAQFRARLLAETKE